MAGSTYTTYEAKAKLSEILRKVRAGESVYVSYRGREVAEIRPIEHSESAAERFRRSVERGEIAPARDAGARLRKIASRPGAVERFLGSRD
jgi:prevent-host-death family protein